MKGIPEQISAATGLEGIDQVVGSCDASNHRFGFVVSRYNQELTGTLLRSAVNTLIANGAAQAHISVIWVPGAYEIPLMVQRMARMNIYSAIIAQGVVIEGETPHAELITREVAHALTTISLEHDVPVIDGVVATRDEEQAKNRCREDGHNRGRYAALAAIEMAQLRDKIGGGGA